MTRELTIPELRSEVEVTRRDLAQLEYQLRLAEGGYASDYTPRCRPGSIADAILRCLEQGEAEPDEIAAMTGRNLNSIRTSVRLLVRAGKIRQIRHGVYGPPAAFSASTSRSALNAAPTDRLN